MQNLDSVVGMDAILNHYQRAYPISQLGKEGPVNFIEGKNGVMYVKRFTELDNGRGCGAAISYTNPYNRPNKLIATKNTIQRFYNDGTAIHVPRRGQKGYFCVLNNKNNIVLNGFMNEMGDVVSLGGIEKEGLKMHGKSSEKAFERIIQKANKYLKKIH